MLGAFFIGFLLALLLIGIVIDSIAGHLEYKRIHAEIERIKRGYRQEINHIAEQYARNSTQAPDERERKGGDDS